jgi:hypothetical protein
MENKNKILLIQYNKFMSHNNNKFHLHNSKVLNKFHLNFNQSIKKINHKIYNLKLSNKKMNKINNRT